VIALRPLRLALLALLPTLALAVQAPAPASVAPAASDGTPRLGIDYEVMPLPAPTFGQGGVEVAEVFSYACIHCAHFQPYVDAWMKHKPADVRWEYVPADFGTVWNTFARAYFAAAQLQVVGKTHAAIFRAVHEEHSAGNGTPEEVAALYGKLGVDPVKFLAAMNNAVTTRRLGQARQFALATGIQGTPTIVIDGRYRITATADRGFPGMLATADYLIAQEHAAINKTTAPASSKKP
jgi:thiol:disulfide interchange protein DsbA